MTPFEVKICQRFQFLTPSVIFQREKSRREPFFDELENCIDTLTNHLLQ